MLLIIFKIKKNVPMKIFGKKICYNMELINNS